MFDVRPFPMKVLLAPDKFKGCLSAADVAAAMARGVREVDPKIEIDSCPVADGGEGTVDALVAATGGRIETRRVTGPLPDMRVDAALGILGDGKTAVVEMAAASGLALLPPEDHDPMRTTTYGTGQLLLEAAKLGMDHIILGIGGSATNDGGIGCAQACGLPVVLDEIGPADPHEPLVGEDLRRVVLVKHARGSPLDRIRITVACDVTNPLFGPEGASRVFGPQKGATPQQIEELDFLLRRLAERCGKIAEAGAPGAGAAGGLGFAMLAFFNAELRGGFDIVADATRLRDRIASADLCLTGEGRFDRSSLHGKAAVGVAHICQRAGIPCALIAGQIADDIGATMDTANDKMFAAHFALSGGTSMSTAQSVARAGELIAETATRATRQLIRRGER
jgi:glycerate kinase